MRRRGLPRTSLRHRIASSAAQATLGLAWALALALVSSLVSLVLPESARAECDTSGLPDGRQVAELQTSLGELCLELLDDPDEAPGHVENFLWYLDNDQLTNTFFHRSVDGFVVQGADYRFDGDAVGRTEARPGVEVTNEPCTIDIPSPDDADVMVCSERGNEAYTVALAKIGGQPNSGTTSWFINLGDNRENLDNQNEGFTVFARITDPASQAVVDAMAAAPEPFPSFAETFWIGAEVEQLRPLTDASGNRLPYFTPALPALDGGGEACADLTSLVTVLQPDLDDLLFELHDPDDETPFYLTISASCSTPIESAIVSWQPGPGTTECPEPDVAALVIDPPQQSRGGIPFVPSPYEYVSLTCDDLATSVAARDALRSEMRGDFFEGLVFIESAEVRVASSANSAPEPGAVPVAATALALFAWLRARRTRRPHVG